MTEFFYLNPQIQVAIKCLSKERMQTQPMEFLKEAAIMHTIDSEHIVRLYGVVLDTNALMLVRESLLELLLGGKKNLLFYDNMIIWNSFGHFDLIRTHDIKFF